MRQKDGKTYSKSSLIGIRASINRHLRNLNQDICIMTDPVFNKSNRMLIAVLKKQKEAGQDRTTHFSRISQADMDIINSPSSFDLNNAEELQQKVFLTFSYNLVEGGGRMLEI